MSTRIPFDAELLFVETTSTGTVHITVKYESWHLTKEPVLETVRGGSAFIALMLTPVLTRCGQRTFPGDPSFTARHQYTDRFSDEQLCAACYRTLHPDDHERAFEHAGSDDEDDEWEAAA